jgi:uncharacterized protein (TIGR01777 family)
MRVLVSGSSGFIGSALVRHLAGSGHRVVRLTRSESLACGDAIPWDPDAGSLDEAALEGVEAVVHLAGESISSGRWSPRKKQRILQSRVLGTALLCEAIARMRNAPHTLVSASACGFYGSRGDETLSEESAPGDSFLSLVTRQWEAATEPARRAGIRVVSLRIGVVLHPSGGALAKMLPLFRLGLGGRIGTGNQYVSWIALDDLLGLILHALTTEGLHGPVNAVAPLPVTNRGFTRSLARSLGRPAFLFVPAWALRLLLGKMAEETLLVSQRVVPKKALESAYRYKFPDIGNALAAMFGK